MDGDRVIKIIFYVVGIGLLVGFAVYKTNRISQRKNAWQMQQNYNQSQATKYYENQKKSSSSADMVKEACDELSSLEHCADKTGNYYKIKKAEAEKKLSTAISVREGELNEELSQARRNGDENAIRRCEQELEKLESKKQLLY
jgi:hypothetical protein